MYITIHLLQSQYILIHQLVHDIINHVYDEEDDHDEEPVYENTKHEAIYENTGFSNPLNGMVNPAMMHSDEGGFLDFFKVSRFGPVER